MFLCTLDVSVLVYQCSYALLMSARYVASFPGSPCLILLSRESLGTRLQERILEQGYRGSLGTRLQGRAWERGYRGEPGNEATGESLGTRLQGEPGNEVTGESLGMRLQGRAWE